MTQKVALVTGGASGIGKSTAMILARKGINVVISGRREDVGKKAVEEIRSQGGGDAALFAADVDNEDQVRGMVEFAVKKYGRLDLAVNNAGISNETKTIGNSDTAKFQAMLQTNVMGVYLCMKYEIGQMLKTGGGSIVNLASIAGLNGIPWAGPYAATKHAVVGLTKSGALDYATQKIRVNAVAPGAIKTDIILGSIAQGQYDEPTISAMHPMGRMGNPDEIAQGIAWLLSDEASFVTGHVLNIDGGFQAK
jgi:NAD(P)-dependent dehydrogenase (short-subunit alcohol dehydrogenase family)